MLLKKFRASSFPTYNDCARLASCSVKVEVDGQEFSLPEYMGFELAPDKRGRKAAIGTALHKGAETILKGLQAGSESPLVVEAIQAMHDKLDEEWVLCEDDDSIKSVESAKDYLDNMFETMAPVLLNIKPVHVEIELSRRLDHDAISTGHPDVIEDIDGVLALRDWKTTNAPVAKPYPAQFGEYGLQAEDAGIDIEIGIQSTFRRLKKKESEHIETPYKMAVVKNFAQATSERFLANTNRFLATGDPNSFNANPNSNLCSPQFCRAWGTPYCPVGKGVN